MCVLLYLLNYVYIAVPVELCVYCCTCWTTCVLLYLLNYVCIAAPVELCVYCCTCWTTCVLLYLLNYVCFAVPVELCVYCCTCWTMCVLLYLLNYVCAAGVTLDAELLAISHYPEGPTTGHLDTGFSWFPLVYKKMLRRFPRFQVATTCFLCSPPDLNLNLSLTSFIFCLYVK